MTDPTIRIGTLLSGHGDRYSPLAADMEPAMSDFVLLFRCWPKERLMFSSEILLYVALGFVAQLVDGALGMAYGLIGTSFLLATGTPPDLRAPVFMRRKSSPPASPALRTRGTGTSIGHCSSGSHPPVSRAGCSAPMSWSACPKT
jgi:hypothetical protein